MSCQTSPPSTSTSECLQINRQLLRFSVRYDCPCLEDILIHAQTVSVEKTPPTKRQHVHEIPELAQPEPKRPRTEVNRSPPIKDRSSVTTESKRSIKHTSMNYYKWNPEHLITFPWLQYDIEERVASCRFEGCKMYHLQFLVSNVKVSGNILVLKPDCLASMRILNFIECSVVKCGT